MQENLVAGFILLVLVAVIVAALDYGPRARMVPIPIAAIGALLILSQIVLQNLRSEKDLKIDLMELIARKATGDDEDLVETQERELAEVEADAEAEPTAVEGWRKFARELGALGVVILLVGMFFVIGPLPTMFAFTAGYFAISGQYPIVKAVLHSLVYTAFVYALFYLWLRIDMRQGLIDLSFGLW